MSMKTGKLDATALLSARANKSLRDDDVRQSPQSDASAYYDAEAGVCKSNVRRESDSGNEFVDFDHFSNDDDVESMMGASSQSTGSLRTDDKVPSKTTQTSGYYESKRGHEIMTTETNTALVPVTLQKSSGTPQRKRRNNRNCRHMESISESPSDTFVNNSDNTPINRSRSSHRQGNSDEQLTNVRVRFNQASSSVSGSTSYSTNSHTRRRRNIASEDGSGSIGSGGSLDRNLRRASGSYQRSRSRQQISHGHQTNDHTQLDVREVNQRDENDKKTSLSPLVASLDAGMATLKRWVRTHAPGLSSGGAGSHSEQSVSTSSLPGIRLGEEDIVALSHAGEDHRGITATTTATSSISGSSNVLETNTNDGFLYYRPLEVEVDPNNEVDTIYGSDDESGAHPLVRYPDMNDNSLNQQTRQRAFSEPDRKRLLDFFSSVYGQRAIDGRRMNMRSRYRSSIRSNNSVQQATEMPSRAIIERRVTFARAPPTVTIEESDCSVENESDQISSSTPISNETDVALNPPPSLIDDSPIHTSASPIVEVNPASVHAVAPSTVSSAPAGPHVVDTDPNRRARRRWIQINRRFQFTVRMVSLLFSLMLFGILVCWVFLITCYVISLDELCDVPLKAYFWLSTLQLVCDIFRADMMKWMCRYRSGNRHVPPRVVFYNFVYVVYSIMILRLGVRCVFLSGSPSCAQTAPELYFVSTVFVCLNLAAWATIFIGYLVPFCLVAILLTWNGYFPNADHTFSSGVIRGGRSRIGAGISGVVEFPNAYSNPAPSGCIERIKVVLLDEILESHPKECCICMSEYHAGEVIVQTPCEHIFHKRCCNEWLQLARTCPVCRADIPNALGMNDDSTVGENVESSMTDPVRDLSENSQDMLTRVMLPNIVRFLRRGGRDLDVRSNSIQASATAVTLHSEPINSSDDVRV